MVASLPERYRITLTCYYFECMNYQEVAELLDQPVGTVKSTISRGVCLLRNLLKKEGAEAMKYHETQHQQGVTPPEPGPLREAPSSLLAGVLSRLKQSERYI